MKSCNLCKEVKFWFQFYTTDEAIYTAVYDVCKKCANKMMGEAVREYQYKLNRNPAQRNEV